MPSPNPPHDLISYSSTYEERLLLQIFASSSRVPTA